MAELGGDVGEHGCVARSGAVEPDVTSIAATVYGADGEIVAALSVLAPSYRMTRHRVEACGRAVARQAAELSESLGYAGPVSTVPTVSAAVVSAVSAESGAAV